MDASGKDTPHPDVARLSRKRSLYNPSEEHNVSRERSTSRQQEVEERGDFTSAFLERKRREEKKIENGERVEKTIKKRARLDFCHECKEQRVFKNLSCKECSHERCVACWVAMTDEGL
jgi:hypothetical protein